jgi:hypothetical protein
MGFFFWNFQLLVPSFLFGGLALGFGTFTPRAEFAD